MVTSGTAHVLIIVKKNRAGVREMSIAITELIVVTIALTIGLGGIIGASLGVSISENWEENRCEPYVVPVAGFFKPLDDGRTAAQFATDNWSFCQKQYIQGALRVAAEVPKGLAEAEAATVSMVQDIASVAADVFFNLWKFCYQTYTTFMDRMKNVAKLFQNFMINMYSIVEKLNAAAVSIIFGLISLIVSTINAIQVTLMVAIIVIGIILVLQILLFFILMPISGLIITVTAIVSVAVVVVATAIAAATVAELFSPGACFATGTLVVLKGGTTKAIEEVGLGDVLEDGGRVTACHSFFTMDTVYDLYGVHVTGDHLVLSDKNTLIPVRDHRDATQIQTTVGQWFQGGTELWCLTTSTRRIPCRGSLQGKESVLFADWEEIAEDDEVALVAWHTDVWTTLNGSPPPAPPSDRVIDAEAGLSPDCRVACVNLWGRLEYKPLKEVTVGTRVFDTPTTTTTVVGKVRIAGDQATDAVNLMGPDGPQFVSCATWVLTTQSHLWKPAPGPSIDIHPIEWQHLYTQSGSFMLDGFWRVRDASDVGLENLRPLVDSIVLASPPIESDHTS
jgi:hypothetical protein